MTQPGKRPNVLLIMADQMTPYALRAYGNSAALTPHIDRLAERGVLFENMYCNSPLCTPSRMSMLSGRYVHRIGSWDNAAPLPTDVPTIAHYFGAAGYRTALSGKMHIVGPDQLHGFEDRLTTDIYPTGMKWTRDWDEPHLHPGRNARTGPITWPWANEYDERAQTRGLEWLRTMALQHDKSAPVPSMEWAHVLPKGDRRPFFLCVSFTNPHPPYLCPTEYWDRYEGAEIELPQWPEGHIENEHIAVKWNREYHQLDELPTDEEVLTARRAYLAQVSYVDDKVGELVACLEKFGMLDDTIVVFTSDHGEMLGEHGCWCKRVDYEWSMKVPFIVSHPGSLPQGRRVGQVCQLVDMLPTLNELADLGPAFDPDGRSTVPLMTGDDSDWPNEALSENYTEGMKASSCMLRKDNLKYVSVVGHEPALYDLDADPDEFTNFAGRPEYAERERTLAARLAELWDGETCDRRVRQSQKERSIILKALRKGDHKEWDYRPTIPEAKPHDLAT
jgi:choline-sulfatase